MISFIVATTGRPTVYATLASIERWDGDEIIVAGRINSINDARVRYVPLEPGNDWGHTERNIVTRMARGRYIAHIDDDDVYAPGARAVMADAIERTPGLPVMFRMRYANGAILWREQVVQCGNVGTPMVLLPNAPDKIGKFGSFYGGDSMFMETMKWQPSEVVWRSEVTVLVRPR
ncbi:MAG: glycosyltransferase family 2 protein [Sulfuricaulis sp.]|nr:glycosyltransferase family 2 protein [Sulfuricaulis sp.]